MFFESGITYIKQQQNKIIRFLMIFAFISDSIFQLNIILGYIMKPLIKLFTGLGALVMLLIGVGILAITIYGFVNSSIFLGDANTKNMVLYIMLGVSIAIIGGSAEGLYGICKEKPKMICAFQIIVIIFLIIFIGVGVGLVYLPTAFFNGDCQNSTNTVIVYASNIYNQSINNYCITCACALDITPYDTANQNIILNKYPNINMTSGAITTSDCIKASLSEPEIALFATIGELEKLLKCSSWCPTDSSTNPNLFYRFNNINSGIPQNFCYPKLQNFFDDFSYYGKIGFFSGGAVLFVMFICNMYLCCCNQQRKKKKNIRERFMIVVETDEDDGYYRRR